MIVWLNGAFGAGRTTTAAADVVRDTADRPASEVATEIASLAEA